ncbi:hypothetical protein F0562_031214 [Nyssa sinensis]|uniref:Uncharacterized protein n=1 Tax=Nyssa sinensis TaxID=561372 RepID=A0A5J5AW39_9ASTE|nr:hypothetical protein F0562_031214 [Nyssa sinensis]
MTALGGGFGGASIGQRLATVVMMMVVMMNSESLNFDQFGVIVALVVMMPLAVVLIFINGASPHDQHHYKITTRERKKIREIRFSVNFRSSPEGEL